MGSPLLIVLKEMTAEATNKTLLKILRMMMYEELKKCSDVLSCSFGISHHKTNPTQAKPFIWCTVTRQCYLHDNGPASLISHCHKIVDLDEQFYNLEALKER